MGKNKQAQLKGKKAAAAKAQVSEAAPAAEAKTPKVAKPVKEGALPPLPRMPSAARTRKPKPMQPCSCGCETPTRSQWAPGHDARARGWAIRIERGICKMADVPANEQAGAKLMLKTRKEAGTTASEPGSKIQLVKKSKGTKETATEPVAEQPQVEPAAEVEQTNPAINQ